MGCKEKLIRRSNVTARLDSTVGHADKILDNIFGVNIMYIQLNINTEVEINNLTDLPKFKLLTESLHMKIKKIQLDRGFGVVRRGALEIPAKVTLKFNLIKGKSVWRK